MLADNLATVQKNIEQACLKAGRDPKEVTLVAVSKTKPVEMLQEAYDAGARVFGENKVQEIMDKYDSLPSDIRWHMIGHLQRNKVKYIIDKVAMIHSVDSIVWLRPLRQEAAKKDLCMPVLLEVNVAEEESKFGLKTSEVLAFYRRNCFLPPPEGNGTYDNCSFCLRTRGKQRSFSQIKKIKC